MTGKHDRVACEFCRSVAIMRQITTLIEDGVPDFDVSLFDDAISEVYNAAENAASILACYAAYDEDHAPMDDTELGNTGYLSVATIINSMECR